MSFEFSNHGHARARQRGFTRRDIDLIRRCGTAVEDREAESYILLSRDVDAEIVARKREIQRLEHLRGCQVVFAGDTLVTACRLTRHAEKMLLRRAE